MLNNIKKKLGLFLVTAIVFLEAQPSQAQWYGAPTSADPNGNTVLAGALVSKSISGSAMIQNTVLGYGALASLVNGQGDMGIGYGAGVGLITGSNDVYIANPGGATNESGVVRIGTSGTHTNIVLGGQLNSTPLTNITTIAQGSVGYTNTSTTVQFVYIYPTNYAFTVYAGFAGTNAIIVAGAVGTPGPYTFMLPVNWCITGTNIAGKAVNSL